MEPKERMTLRHSWNPAVPRAQKRRQALARVLARQLGVGSLVPSSRALASALGVSRMAAHADVRAALRMAGLAIGRGPNSRLVVLEARGDASR